MEKYVRSPNYPRNYGNHRDIIWEIQAPDGFRVNAVFLDFVSESDYDFLRVGLGTGPYDQGSYELHSFTGTNYANEVTSPGQYMWLYFTSDVSTSARGFVVELSTVPHSGQF